MPDFAKPTLAWSLLWDADWVTAVTFVGSTRRIVAGNNLGGMLAWDLPDKPGGDVPSPVLRLDGHTNCVSRLAASADGKTLLSASYDHTVRLWDATTAGAGSAEMVLNARTIEDAERRKNNGAKVPPAVKATVKAATSAQTFDAHKEWVVGMELCRDGETVITGDDAGRVLVWNRGTRKVAREWRVKGWAYAVALSPDAKQACVGERFPLVFDGGRHAALKLWDAAAGTALHDLSAEFKGQHIGSAAYSPDGKLLAVGRGGEGEGTVSLIDPATGKRVRALTPVHYSGVTDIAWHPDGKHFASSGRDTVIRIWEAESGKLIAEVGKSRGGQFKDWVHAISWSADGRWLAAADMIGAVQVWHFGA